MTKAWRDKYDSIFTSVSKKALRNKQRQAAAGGDADGGHRRESGIQQRLGAGAPPDQLVKASRKLNKFLRNFIIFEYKKEDPKPGPVSQEARRMHKSSKNAQIMQIKVYI